MDLYDYRSTDLAGAAYYGRILADGFDCLDEPSLSELADDEGTVLPASDAEVRAVFEEVYGPFGAVADLPF